MKTRVLCILLSSLTCLALLALFAPGGTQAAAGLASPERLPVPTSTSAENIELEAVEPVTTTDDAYIATLVK